MNDDHNSTWPDPTRPGVPRDPEQDGWHWINGGPIYWHAQSFYWNDGAEVYCTSPEIAARYRWVYRGPLAYPAEVAALRARIAELEAVERAARNVAVNANRGNDGVSAVPGCLIDDLRAALGVPSHG